MSLKSLVNALMIGSIATASLLPMAGTAVARDGYRNDGYRGHSVQRYNDGPRVNRWGDVKRHDWNGGQEYAYRGYGGYGEHRGYRRHRDHTGRNVAIGAFAAILGLAIAAESQRVRDEYYRD